MSGQQFAKWAGIKYGTFITWVQKRRRKAGESQADGGLASAGTKAELRWVEAVLEKATAKKSDTNPNATVMIVQGASGVRIEVSDAKQVSLAVQLLRELDGKCRC